MRADEAASPARALIHIKAGGGARSSFQPDLEKKGGTALPTDIAITVAAIVLVFVVFGASLAWADYYSNSTRQPGPHP
jgi:hypothetical protein